MPRPMDPRPVSQEPAPDGRVPRPVDREWVAARLTELRLTQARVAEVTGMRRESVTRGLQGTREFSSSELVALSELFRVSLTEMAQRVGVGSPAGRLARAGRVLADSRVSSIADDTVDVRHVLTHRIDVVAYTVDRVTGPLAPWSGSVLVVVPTSPPAIPDAAKGRPAIVEDAASPLALLGVLAVDSASVALWTGEHVALVRPRAAHPVVSVHLPVLLKGSTT